MSLFYEILAYNREFDRPCYMDKTQVRNFALSDARVLCRRYWRVEVNAVYTSDYDSNDVKGTDLIAAWENGKKTTK